MDKKLDKKVSSSKKTKPLIPEQKEINPEFVSSFYNTRTRKTLENSIREAINQV